MSTRDVKWGPVVTNSEIFHDWLRIIGDTMVLTMLLATICMVFCVQKNF